MKPAPRIRLSALLCLAAALALTGCDGDTLEGTAQIRVFHAAAGIEPLTVNLNGPPDQPVATDLLFREASDYVDVDAGLQRLLLNGTTGDFGVTGSFEDLFEPDQAYTLVVSGNVDGGFTFDLLEDDFTDLFANAARVRVLHRAALAPLTVYFVEENDLLEDAALVYAVDAGVLSTPEPLGDGFYNVVVRTEAGTQTFTLLDQLVEDARSYLYVLTDNADPSLLSIVPFTEF